MQRCVLETGAANKAVMPLKPLWLLLHENVQPHPAHILYNSVVSEAQRGPVFTATDAGSAPLVLTY